MITFGQNQMLYTVKNYIEEFPELVYNDGVKKLFLYVGGELGGTEKLKSLLQYFSKSDTSNVTDADLEHLMQKFSLTMEEAKAYLNETTNLM